MIDDPIYPYILIGKIISRGFNRGEAIEVVQRALERGLIFLDNLGCVRLMKQQEADIKSLEPSFPHQDHSAQTTNKSIQLEFTHDSQSLYLRMGRMTSDAIYDLLEGIATLLLQSGLPANGTTLDGPQLLLSMRMLGDHLEREKNNPPDN
jgi:hypothetical protein